MTSVHSRISVYPILRPLQRKPDRKDAAVRRTRFKHERAAVQYRYTARQIEPDAASFRLIFSGGASALKRVEYPFAFFAGNSASSVRKPDYGELLFPCGSYVQIPSCRGVFYRVFAKISENASDSVFVAVDGQFLRRQRQFDVHPRFACRRCSNLVII